MIPPLRAAIVCGPRDGSGQDIVSHAMDLAYRGLRIPRFDFITVGSRRGTDEEARTWAMRREIPCLTVPALFATGKLGRAEGPMRNRRMHGWVRPVVVPGFFPCGTGTFDMMTVACERRTPAYWWAETEGYWLGDERVGL